MKTKFITDCINITGNAGHKIEHLNAKKELAEIETQHKELLRVCQATLADMISGELFNNDETQAMALENIKAAIKKLLNKTGKFSG